MDYVFSLGVMDFIELVDTLLEKQQHEVEKDIDNKLYFRWVLEMLLSDKPVNFHEYKDMAFGRVGPQQSSDEIISKFEQISEAYQEGG